MLFSEITGLISLSAVMPAPSPAFHSMAFRIMVAVVFILAPTLTFLTAVHGAPGHTVDKLAVKWVHSGEHCSLFSTRWAERIWERPFVHGVLELLELVALLAPLALLSL